ncbi:MAG: thymidylate synthase [Bacilli bacterium]|nr:thymidylate synthase [Bacilli bacterium]
MTGFDIEYLKLLKKILTEGVEVENRTGINTVKVPSHTFEFDLSKEYPILTTKQTFYTNAIIEMLWIWQMQSNDVRELQKRKVPIWNEWMVDEDGIYRIYEPKVPGKDYVYDPDKEVVVLNPLSVPVDNPNKELSPMIDENGKIMTAKSLIPGKTIKRAIYYGKDYAYTIGTAYGFITNRYKHTQNLINTIKNNPNDRRLVKSLWQDEFLRTAVLPSCVWSTEWDVTNGKLNLSVHQRSCDVPLGLPFNITQYSTFLKMIASVTNLEPGKISYSIKDAHIYLDQIDGIKEQIRRERLYNDLSKFDNKMLYDFKKHIEKEMNLIEDKKCDRYIELDTEYRIADMILEPTKPELWIDPSVDDFFKFDNSRELKHIKVKSYKHMGKIPMPIAQ